jgi:hypothetical protein
MTNKELLYFVGKCLSLDKQERHISDLAGILGNGEVNWLRFVRICSNHLVTPLIFNKLKEKDLMNFLPEEMQEYLKDIYHLNQSRNHQILSQIKEINTLMNKESISPLFLKGSGNLMDGLYKSTGDRIMGDIDFLVSENDFRRAACILEQEGYIAPSLVFRDINQMKHFPRLNHPNKIASVEIHRLPVPEDYTGWFSPEMVFNESRPARDLPECLVLSDKHKIVLNFIHSQLSNYGSRTAIVSLRDMYDYKLLNERVKPEQVLEHINPVKKAMAYFELAEKVIPSETDKKRTEQNIWNFLIFRHDLNLQFYSFYRINKIVVYLYLRIFNGYLKQFIQSFYNPLVRKSVIERLSDPRWYRAHLRSWKE